MKKIVLLGITGGIAAYKTLDLIRILQKEKIAVKVIMTRHATQMISPQKLEKTIAEKVYQDLFTKNFDYKEILTKRKVDHIELADTTNVMVIVPASANVIAKLAAGIADDFLTTTVLAVTAPIIICPSMNVNMWLNDALQENLTKLKQRGFIIIEPDRGMLACGYEGVGRLADLGKIKDEIMNQLNRTTSLKNKLIIVTAGGTHEKIDDVRFITNRSSGKMGIAIAEECVLRGADVILLRAKTAIKPRYLMFEEIFETAKQLSELISKYIKKADAIYHAAAVSDFGVTKPFPGKLTSKSDITLNLVQTPKILDKIKRLNPKIKLIAFKAESEPNAEKLIQKAHARLIESGADVIVANDVSRPDRGFGVDTNEVFVIRQNAKPQKIALAHKRTIAQKLVEITCGLFS